MSLIYGLICLLVILFAGAMVLGIIMFIKESFAIKTENTVIKSSNPTEKSITCEKCGQKLNAQHIFCPFCGNKQDELDEKDEKNVDAKSDIETESIPQVEIDITEDNNEVIEESPENELDNNEKVDSTNIEKTKPVVVLNENEITSSNDASEKQAEDAIINENINIVEDIYQSQSKWINGENEKAEDIVQTQELLKASNYKPHNKKQKRRNI